MKYYKANRQKKTLEAKLRRYDQEETILTQEIMQLEACKYDSEEIETTVNSVSDELKYAYLDGYYNEGKKLREIEETYQKNKEPELKRQKTNNENSSMVSKNDVMETLTNNFDVYIRSILIKKANKLSNGGYNND